MKEKTCATCVMWERDLESKAGGWCPIPNPKDPFKRPYKYVRQSHKACKHYKGVEQ
jgi:hypothetical protein